MSTKGPHDSWVTRLLKVGRAVDDVDSQLAFVQRFQLLISSTTHSAM